MKKQLLVSIAFMLVSSLGVFAQQTDFAKFLIRNAYVNGRDYSLHYRQAGAFLVLYDDDDEMSMAIVMGKRDSVSI